MEKKSGFVVSGMGVWSDEQDNCKKKMRGINKIIWLQPHNVKHIYAK